MVARQVNWGTWCDAYAATPRPLSIACIASRVGPALASVGQRCRHSISACWTVSERTWSS
eukprot:13920518-Heterocapsa_arctica.AAC.1